MQKQIGKILNNNCKLSPNVRMQAKYSASLTPPHPSLTTAFPVLLNFPRPYPSQPTPTLLTLELTNFINISRYTKAFKQQKIKVSLFQ